MLYSILAVGSWSYAATMDDLIAQAQAEIKSGHADRALQNLLQYEQQYAGELQFDQTLGQAAIAADVPSRAIFAFERCLIMDPSNTICNAGMARAHLKLSELDAARQILNRGSLDKSSRQYQDLLSDYRRLVLGEQRGTDTRFNLWLQAGLGFDSNVNSATTRSRVFLPIIDQDYDLHDASRKRDSFFHQTQIGLNYSTSINENWRFLVDGMLRTKNYWRMHSYDAIIADARIGVQRSKDRHRFTARLMGQYYNLGGHNYRNMLGLSAQYAYAITDTTELGGFIQYANLQYPSNSKFNANRTVLGLNGSQQLANGNALVYASVYGGREATVHKYSNNKHYSYDLAGLQLGAAWLMTPRDRLELNAGVEKRRYDSQDPYFQRKRKDTQYRARLGLVHAVNRKFSIRPSYQYIKTNSSVVLRDYSRHIFMLDFRYAIF